MGKTLMKNKYTHLLTFHLVANHLLEFFSFRLFVQRKTFYHFLLPEEKLIRNYFSSFVSSFVF
jgi:hypothetical protein